MRVAMNTDHGSDKDRGGLGSMNSYSVTALYNE